MLALNVMWNHLTGPFARLLSDHLYPVLYSNPDYQSFLANAGLHPPYPRDATLLSPSQRKRLAENALLRANLLGLEVDGLKSLKSDGAQAVRLQGPLHLYRLWNSAVKGNEMRYFWFREELLRESFQKAGGRKADRLEWLRGQLAVAYNWSRCDRLAKLDLGPRETLPAVEAEGLPIRAVHIGPQDRTVKLPEDPREYWRNHAKYSAMLPGGVPQLFLFLVPESSVFPYW